MNHFSWSLVSIAFIMPTTTTTDWNTVTSDLQRAANNLAWFVLESMAIPDQLPPFVTAFTLSPSPPQMLPQDSSDIGGGTKRKRVDKMSKGSKQLRKAVDSLVSETLM